MLSVLFSGDLALSSWRMKWLDLKIWWKWTRYMVHGWWCFIWSFFNVKALIYMDYLQNNVKFVYLVKLIILQNKKFVLEKTVFISKLSQRKCFSYNFFVGENIFFDKYFCQWPLTSLRKTFMWWEYWDHHSNKEVCLGKVFGNKYRCFPTK